MTERFWERIGILKHQVTAEEMNEAYLKERELTVEYMKGRMSLENYNAELDKLPKLDIVKLAHDLNYKG